MLRCEIKLKIYNPDAPLLPPGEALLGDLVPTAVDTQDAAAFGSRVFMPKDRGASVPEPDVAGAALRLPIRDRLRANLIRIVASRSPVPVSQDRIEEAVEHLASERPLLEWLANGGLESLVRLVLAMLKLAA